MLKTNSKKARENVRNYINETECEYHKGETLKETCANIWRDFKNYYTRGNYQEEFTKWAQGLPGDLFDYHYFPTAKKILGDILEETEEERERFTETDAERKLTYLIYMEIVRNIDNY